MQMGDSFIFIVFATVRWWGYVSRREMHLPSGFGFSVNRSSGEQEEELVYDTFSKNDNTPLPYALHEIAFARWWSIAISFTSRSIQGGDLHNDTYAGSISYSVFI